MVTQDYLRKSFRVTVRACGPNYCYSLPRALPLGMGLYHMPQLFAAQIIVTTPKAIGPSAQY